MNSILAKKLKARRDVGKSSGKKETPSLNETFYGNIDSQKAKRERETIKKKNKAMLGFRERKEKRQCKEKKTFTILNGESLKSNNSKFVS